MITETKTGFIVPVTWKGYGAIEVSKDIANNYTEAVDYVDNKLGSLSLSYGNVEDIPILNKINPMMINCVKTTKLILDEEEKEEESLISRAIKEEIESIVDISFKSSKNSLDMQELTNKVMYDDIFWSDFDFNIKEIIEEYINDNEIPMGKHMYPDFTEDKKYAYDLYEIKTESGHKRFQGRFFDKSLNEMVDIIIDDNPRENFEVEQHNEFEDWYNIYDNSNEDSYDRVQLFQ